MVLIQENVTLSAAEQELDDRMVRMVHNAVERSKIKGAPVARYDPIRKAAYLEYPDGKKRYSK